MKTEKQTAKRIHPKKFAMWMAIGSMIMMFAGFTSAVIVRQAQGDWVELQIPSYFYISTAVIALSSVTMWFTVKTFKERKMKLHQSLVVVTVILGLLFALFQYLGFEEMMGHTFWNNNVSMQFIAAIVGVHVVHVLGGIIVLLIMLFSTFSRSVKTYSVVGIELISTYWHFVDFIWVYLLLFFIYIA